MVIRTKPVSVKDIVITMKPLFLRYGDKDEASQCLRYDDNDETTVSMYGDKDEASQRLRYDDKDETIIS